MENEELLETKIEDMDLENDVVESSVSEEAIEAIETSRPTENLINDTTEIKVDALMEDAKWYVLHTISGYENVAKGSSFTQS